MQREGNWHGIRAYSMSFPDNNTVSKGAEEWGRVCVCVFEWACVTYRCSLDRLLRLDIHLHHHSLWCCPPLFPHCSAHPRLRFGPDLETSPESPEPKTHGYEVYYTLGYV